MNNRPQNKRKFISCFAAGFLMLSFLLSGCSDKNEAEPKAQSTRIYQPKNFPPLPPQPANNPLTKEGIELGKMLFFDTKLSGDNTLSCGSCHVQSAAFADPGKAFSIGSGGEKTHRNSQSLFNLAWIPAYFWDGGAADLESQAIAPIQAHNEMNQNFGQLVATLQADAQYPKRFQEAFGSSNITSQQVLFALAQFQRTLVSGNSRYDKFVRKEAGGQLSSLELTGRSAFESKCASCHSTDLFTDNNYHNNGLDSVFPPDNEGIAQGRGRITNNPADIGKFRTPSLRNVALTAPYMHDGRFSTLSEVLDHYTHGVQHSATLAPELQTGHALGISISSEEKESIIAFLHTLTDSEFIANPAFAKP